MRVYWLEQREKDVPSDNNWLSSVEIECLDKLQFAKRRADWRLGRWTAKRGIVACLNWPRHPRVLARIQIVASPSGAPEAVLPHLATPVTISLSHREGIAVCAIASAGVKLGCDLEVIEHRDPAFVADYFTPLEQSLISRATPAEQPALVTLLWSAKESVLKALREGLRLDTRSVIVTPGVGAPDEWGWSPLHACHTDGQGFHGWWRTNERMIHTVLADSRPDCPILLEQAKDKGQFDSRIDLRGGMLVSTEPFQIAAR
jgi:4'-phosphopantetheinyl transferase